MCRENDVHTYWLIKSFKETDRSTITRREYMYVMKIYNFTQSIRNVWKTRI